MNLQVKGKVYIVAASSKGLGFGIARELAKNGATVCISSRTEKEVKKAALDLQNETGSVIHSSVFDASNKDSIQSWISNVEKAFERIDGLVINAGGPPPGNFDDFTDEDWETAFNLTLMSAVRLIRGVLPIMRSSASGSILTVTSLSVKEPIDGLLLSNAFRAGVTSLVKSLSNELASDGIRVNNLMPGRIVTDRLKALDKSNAKKSGISVTEIEQNVQKQIPLGRYGTIEEFGKVGAFLLSPAASYITGVSLAVDGGLLKTV